MKRTIREWDFKVSSWAGDIISWDTTNLQDFGEI